MESKAPHPSEQVHRDGYHCVYQGRDRVEVRARPPRAKGAAPKHGSGSDPSVANTLLPTDLTLLPLMGASSSSPLSAWADHLSRLGGPDPIAHDDPLWKHLLSHGSYVLAAEDPHELATLANPSWLNMIKLNRRTHNCQTSSTRCLPGASGLGFFCHTAHPHHQPPQRGVGRGQRRQQRRGGVETILGDGMEVLHTFARVHGRTREGMAWSRDRTGGRTGSMPA